MQQKKASGQASRHWPHRTPTCHFCKNIMARGEEDIYYGGQDPKHMHRACLEQWLENHPPLDGTVPPRKIQQVQEIETEFETLRRKLMREAKAQKTTGPSKKKAPGTLRAPARPARKPRPKP